jgi:hypothetical protein
VERVTKTLPNFKTLDFTPKTSSSFSAYLSKSKQRLI